APREQNREPRAGPIRLVVDRTHVGHHAAERVTGQRGCEVMALVRVVVEREAKRRVGGDHRLAERRNFGCKRGAVTKQLHGPGPRYVISRKLALSIIGDNREWCLIHSFKHSAASGSMSKGSSSASSPTYPPVMANAGRNRSGPL